MSLCKSTINGPLSVDMLVYQMNNQGLLIHGMYTDFPETFRWFLDAINHIDCDFLEIFDGDFGDVRNESSSLLIKNHGDIL